MNLADLSHLDIKDLQNLDYRKLLDDLLKRPDMLINTALAGITVLVCGYLVLGAFKEGHEIKTKIDTTSQKIAAIEAYASTKSELEGFTARVLNGLPEDEMLSHMTAFAGNRGIKIESISPTITQQHDLYSSTLISLSISAKSYKDLWLFVNDIEQAPYSLRISRWEGSGTGDEKQESVKAKLDINSIKINYEK